jgi:hypothetical protein
LISSPPAMPTADAMATATAIWAKLVLPLLIGRASYGFGTRNDVSPTSE